MNQMQKTEVLFIIDHLDAGGGTQNLLANMVKGLKKLDYHLTVVSLNGGDRHFIQALRNDGIEALVFNGINLWLWGIPKIFYLIRKRKISIIQNFLFYSNIIGRILGKIARVPVISSIWGDGNTYKIWEIWLDRITNKFDDYIVVNSKAGHKFCVEKFKIPEKKIELIYNGIKMPESVDFDNVNKLRDIYKIPKGKIIFGTIGRLSEEKGYNILLDAFRLALQENSNLFLMIVGIGNLEKELKYQVDKLDIGSQVIFVDYIKEVELFYNLIDVFVLSSLSEGLPNVILEAMFYEKPVIASAVGDIPDLIENGVSGLLVSPGNPADLAEAMKLLVRDKDFTRKLSAKTKKIVTETYSQEKMVDSFNNLYQRFSH